MAKHSVCTGKHSQKRTQKPNTRQFRVVHLLVRTCSAFAADSGGTGHKVADGSWHMTWATTGATQIAGAPEL